MTWREEVEVIVVRGKKGEGGSLLIVCDWWMDAE